MIKSIKLASYDFLENLKTNQSSAPVSVVIPCFRCSDTINRAVESIAQQTVKPAEVILVDDESNDDTLNVLRAIENQYFGWVKVVALTNNSGAASARNVGWDVATQPYLALLDADDAWHPKKIEIQYQFMNKNPEIVLCGHDAKIVLDSNLPNWPLSDTTSKTFSKNSLLLSNPFVTPSIMMKKDLSLRFNPTKRHMEDHLLWLQIFFCNYKVVKLNSTLVAIYKPMFGASGLSSNLWAMEKSELDNYFILYKNKSIGFVILIFLCAYSLIKYLRRLIVVGKRNSFDYN